MVMNIIISIVFTLLALLLIPTLFIFRRLSISVSAINFITFFKLAISRYHDNGQNINNGICDGNGGEKGRMFPKHVAVILDGNRRWAEKRGLETSEGHKAGARKVIENAKDCFSLGVNTISLFAFSTENWSRPHDEVNTLMDLFVQQLKSELPYFQRDKIKISVIGNRGKLSKSLISLIDEAEEATKKFEDKHLIVAIDYSGKYDILEACKSIAEKTRDGLVQIEEIDELLMEKELMTKCSEFPSPDLLIRTSGEQRISNFFLWQSAYTELYFSPVMWPDFGKAEYLQAMTWYQQRQRRFGQRI